MSLLQKTSYSYDGLGRYTEVAVNDETKIWYDYDSQNLQLLRKRFANGWLIRYEQSAEGVLRSLVATNEKDEVITDCRFQWRADGKLDQRTLNGVHHQYCYDALGRLTEVVKTSP